MKFRELLNIDNISKKELNVDKKYEGISKNSNEKTSLPNNLEIQEDEKKAKSYIRKGLDSGLEFGKFSSISLLSLLMFILDKGGKQIRKYAYKEFKGAYKEFTGLSI